MKGGDAIVCVCYKIKCRNDCEYNQNGICYEYLYS